MPHCVRWGPSSPSPKEAQPPPILGPYLLRPNGCMDQDVTWYVGRPRPRRLCVRWEPRSPPQIFGPCLLRPNGWMDEAGTWHGGRPRPRRLCVRWGPSPLPPPQFSAHFYFGQTAACIKIPLGMELGPRPRRLCVRWGPSSPLPQRGTDPQFSAHVYCGETAGSRWHLAWR